jgi:hypothetical protein
MCAPPVVVTMVTGSRGLPRRCGWTWNWNATQEQAGMVLRGSPPVLDDAAIGEVRASRPKPLDNPPGIR